MKLPTKIILTIILATFMSMCMGCSATKTHGGVTYILHSLTSPNPKDMAAGARFITAEREGHPETSKIISPIYFHGGFENIVARGLDGVVGDVVISEAFDDIQGHQTIIVPPASKKGKPSKTRKPHSNVRGKGHRKGHGKGHLK